MTSQHGESGGNTRPTHPFDDLTESWLFETDDGPALAQSSCLSCGAVMMGRRHVCSTCLATDLVIHAAPREGTLYSYSTVYVSPFSNDPYTLGYVDLAGGARVLGRVQASQPLRCDLPMSTEFEAGAWFFAPAERTTLT